MYFEKPFNWAKFFFSCHIHFKWHLALPKYKITATHTYNVWAYVHFLNFYFSYNCAKLTVPHNNRKRTACCSPLISIQNKNMKVRLKNMFDLTHQKQEKKRGRTRKSTIFQKIMNSMGNCNTLCHFTVQCTKRLASHRRVGTNAGVVDEVLKALHFDGDLPHTMRIF